MPRGRGRSDRREGRSTRWQALAAAPAPYLLPAVAFAAVLSVYPLVQLARMAVSDVGPANLIGDWELVGAANFREVLADPGFWEAARATGVFTIVVLVANLTLGYLAATVLARQSRLGTWVLSLMVFVWALPPLVSGSVWKFILAGDGAVNSLLAMAGLPTVDWLSSPDVALMSVSFVAAWASVPFAALVIRGGLLGIPREVMEAAALDGAGTVRTAASVILPLLRPTLTVLVILTVLYSFRSFDFVYVMTSGGPGTTTTTLPYLAYQTAFRTYAFGIGSAVAVLSMLVVAVIAVPYVLGVRREERS